MKIRSIIVPFIVSLAFLGCNDPDDGKIGPYTGPGMVIYKTKQDYRSNIFIGMNNEKNQVISNPSIRSIKSVLPIQLTDNFLLATGFNGLWGVNCVPTSITLFDSINIDTIHANWINYIIDKDPFIEYYQSKEFDWGVFFNEKEEVRLIDPDTAELNRIIRAGELEKYFRKEK